MPIIVTDQPSIYAVLPFITIVALGAGFLVVFRQRAAARRASAHPARTSASVTDSRPDRHRVVVGRPWWGNPLLWLAVCAVSFVLGFVVWRGLFGGVFLVLPFVWVWRPRRERRMDPRTNGHTNRDAGTFTGD